MIRRQPSLKALSDPDGVFGLARVKGNATNFNFRVKYEKIKILHHLGKKSKACLFLNLALHDLDEKELSQCVSKFNRRLTKRFSTCHIDIPKENFNNAHNCDDHPGYELRCIRYM